MYFDADSPIWTQRQCNSSYKEYCSMPGTMRFLDKDCNSLLMEWPIGVDRKVHLWGKLEQIEIWKLEFWFVDTLLDVTLLRKNWWDIFGEIMPGYFLTFLWKISRDHTKVCWPFVFHLFMWPILLVEVHLASNWESSN